MWSEEAATGLPIEVNVVIQSPDDIRNDISGANAARDGQENTTGDFTVIYERDKFARTKIPSKRTNGVNSVSASRIRHVKQRESYDVSVINVRENDPKFKIPGHHARTNAASFGHKQEINKVAIILKSKTKLENSTSRGL